MELLGDKIGSTLIAQSLGISCVPWSGSDVTCDVPHVLSVKRISGELIKSCSVSCIEDVIKACERIGFPVVIKASSGGGGRGIRQVFRYEDIESAYYQVISEVKDSLIFVMKLLRNCR
jgi:acetyl-CoA carboxylase / biotin carboxylase 1